MITGQDTAPRPAKIGRPNGRKKKIRWTDELFREKVMKPLAEGQTINAIAESLNITRQSVTLRLKAHGINNKTEALQEILRLAREGQSL